MSRSKGGETAAAAFLDEGARTMGVWLPVALADILMALMALIRQWATKPDEIELPARSETLQSWMLPTLSRAFKAAEKEVEADKKREQTAVLLTTLQNIQAKYGAKPNQP